MPTRWQPPGYRALVEAIIKTRVGSVNKSRFAQETGLRPDQVSRWVKTLPEDHDSLLIWARAPGVPWTEIVTATDASAAESDRPPQSEQERKRRARG